MPDLRGDGAAVGRRECAVDVKPGQFEDEMCEGVALTHVESPAPACAVCRACLRGGCRGRRGGEGALRDYPSTSSMSLLDRRASRKADVGDKGSKPAEVPASVCIKLK